MKVLFVCTGNTCRSPMAEGILKDLAEKKGLDIEAASAGISVYFGDMANIKSIEAMDKIGLDISGHISKHLSEEMVEEADLILTMSRNHKESILFSHPDGIEKIFTLNEYGLGRNRDIKDPFGQSLEVYEKTRDEIYKAIEGLIDNGKLSIAK